MAAASWVMADPGAGSPPAEKAARARAAARAGSRAGSGRCRRRCRRWTAQPRPARGRRRRRSGSGGRRTASELRRRDALRRDDERATTCARTASGPAQRSGRAPDPVAGPPRLPPLRRARRRRRGSCWSCWWTGSSTTRPRCVEPRAGRGAGGDRARRSPTPGSTGRVVVPPGLPDGWCPDGVAGRARVHPARPRRVRRRRHRRRPRRARRPGRSRSTARPTRAGGRSRWCPTCTCASCARTRSSRPCPSCSPGWSRPGRRRSSAGRRRPATSSWSGSRACTGRAR